MVAPVVKDENDRTDARPFIRVSGLTSWREALKQRDAFFSEIQSSLEAAGIIATTTQSPSGAYPIWIQMEAWLPDRGDEGGETDARVRTSLIFTFDVRPFHESPLSVTAVANNGRRQIEVRDRPRFEKSLVADWVSFTLGRSDVPRNYSPVTDALVATLVSVIPFVRGPHSNRVRRAFRDAIPITVPQVMVVSGFAILAFGVFDLGQPYRSQTGAGGVALVISVILLLVAWRIFARRKRVISVIEHPKIPPRDPLVRVDSWHAVIPNLGPRLEILKQRIRDRLVARLEGQITSETEIYRFRGPNGLEERERLVVSKGQGVAHLHIYQFGGDVFVGWDSYLNWAKWGETSAVSSQASIGRIVEYRSLEPQFYLPNQYDLIDLNSLAELLHRDVTDIIRAMMKEYEIDEEIDFQIIRGDRENALDESRVNKRRSEGTRSRSAAGDRSSRGRSWRLS